MRLLFRSVPEPGANDEVGRGIDGRVAAQEPVIDGELEHRACDWLKR